MEEDLILGDPEEINELNVIDNQLMLICSLADIDDTLYDDLQADKILVMAKAFKVIHEAQKRLLKALK